LAAPRILIVDDQRDISRMLRAALETLGRGYVIVDVPSAEEAQLEFRRGPVDLLITDLRLPGISGLDLIRRLHKASSEARMIVISAYADETARAEFRNLGAAFFAKPLNLEAFLKGVQQALGGREPAAADPGHDEQPGLAERLARLRRDLDALAAFLVGLDGSVVAQAGEAASLDLNALLPHVLEAFSASLRVSQVLGGNVPANVHFFGGTTYDIYAANVGPSFVLVISFDGQRGAAQMGTALRYGRHAADDLLNTLPNELARQDRGAVGGKLAAEAAVEARPARKIKTGPLRKTGPLPALKPAEPAPEKKKPDAPSAPSKPVSPEAAQALDKAAEKTTSKAAADFWDAVDGAGIGDERADTLTWEEAAKRGILPSKTPPEK
jgi:DNA-binding response OmpR family regulator